MEGVIALHFHHAQFSVNQQTGEELTVLLQEGEAVHKRLSHPVR